ncbi:MAG: germination protein YpeB [Clostridia bacterium]|nr:germination protein YpeB [Clostridia bacterium]
MEEKKSTKKVGVNTSSGAKKVERIEKEKRTMPKTKAQSADGAVKKTVTKKVQIENSKADLRTRNAKAKAERKERREMLRAERKQLLQERKLEAKERAMERRMQAEERAQERRAARAARKDMLKNETAVQRLERKERERQDRIALRKQNAELRHELELKRKEERIHKRQLAEANRRHKREENTKRRKNRTPGFGGWLAAVISLGAASLAMLTVITIGGINMNNMSLSMADGYRSQLYELTELSENLGSNLDKLRIATGAKEQRKLLTDILVQSELMEGTLERVPVDMATTNNITSFVNRTSEYARAGLNQSASGRTLGEKDSQTIEYMYQINASILSELQRLRDTMTPKDWTNLIRNKKKGAMNDSFENLNSNVIQTPSSIQDGPFSENKQQVTAKGLLNAEEITSAKAEELARNYFADYHIKSTDYTGEVSANGVECFNITLTDERDREMYAQISKAGGKLIMFDSFEHCQANNFSQEECVQIAQKFLTKLGMQNMKAVWLQENGATANINFVYEQDGVLCYSDMVIVKVCETKGMPVGMQAHAYYLNHGERSIPSPAVSQEQAQTALGNLTPKTARLALIPYEGEEVLSYEFSGDYSEHEYFAYISAETGEELELFKVLNTKQGRLLR